MTTKPRLEDRGRSERLEGGGRPEDCGTCHVGDAAERQRSHTDPECSPGPAVPLCLRPCLPRKPPLNERPHLVYRETPLTRADSHRVLDRGPRDLSCTSLRLVPAYGLPKPFSDLGAERRGTASAHPTEVRFGPANRTFGALRPSGAAPSDADREPTAS